MPRPEELIRPAACEARHDTRAGATAARRLQLMGPHQLQLARCYAEVGMIKCGFDLKGMLPDPNPPAGDLEW